MRMRLLIESRLTDVVIRADSAFVQAALDMVLIVQRADVVREGHLRDLRAPPRRRNLLIMLEQRCFMYLRWAEWLIEYLINFQCLTILVFLVLLLSLVGILRLGLYGGFCRLLRLRDILKEFVG